MRSLKWPCIKEKSTHFACKVDGVGVFAWDPGFPVFTDGAALCVGLPVAVGGAAAYQGSIGPTGTVCVRSTSVAVPVGYRISSGITEHVAMHMACVSTKLGLIAVVSDSAAIGKSKLLEAEEVRDGERKHAGFWELQDRIKEVGWVRNHLTVKQGIAASFRKEWIVGIPRADKLADEAMRVLADPASGEKRSRRSHQGGPCQGADCAMHF